MTRRSSPLGQAILLAPWAVAAGAALGTALYKRWGYRVRTRRRDVARVDAPPPAAETAGRAAVQHADSGTGPLFRRQYRITLDGGALGPEDLMARIGQDVQAFVPAEVARFEKMRGAEAVLAPGDEFTVRMTAPWNGPVRVVDVGPRHFTLATLEGHMEAGQIRFSAEAAPEPGALVFAIESWARSRDGAVHLVYDVLGLAQAAQQAMWTFFCTRVAETCGGTPRGDVEVLTERAE